MSKLAILPERLGAPIEGDNPVGDDVTYEPVFERLKQAVDRLASVGTGVDHENVTGEGPFADESGASHQGVVDGAMEVLAEHSKDLRAAAYLAASLAHTDGTDGVASGLGVMLALADSYWDDLYPSRPRARRAAFEFMATRLVSAVASWDAPERSERESLDKALATLAELQTQVADRMGDNAPALSGVRRALSERLRRVPEESSAPTATETTENEPSAPDAPGVSSAPVAKPTVAPSPPPPRQSSPTVPDPSVAPSGDPVRAVVQASATLREASPTSPTALRLLRVVRWDALAAAPPAVDSATRLEPPPARRRTALEGLATSDPAVFFEQAELAFSTPPFHFWLDLQRLADSACVSLGTTHADARRAIREEMQRLLTRLPGMLNLQFRDGTPFADAATRAWATSLAPPRSADRDAAPPSAANNAFADARDRVADGDLTGALDNLGAVPGGRAGFAHQVQVADLCLAAGRADLAYGILSSLSTVADARNLDNWEPDLVADVYAALVRAARQLGRSEEAASAAARLAAVASARAARELSA